MSMMVVFTAITGNFPDKLHEVTVRMEKDPVEFVCISDGSARTAPYPWKLMRPIWEHEDPRRTARYHKIMAHKVFPGADFSLWMDANQQLTTCPWTLVEKYLSAVDFATYTHPYRHDIWEEQQICSSWKLDDEAVMKAQVEHYRTAGLPQSAGLMETTLVLRRHSAKAGRFNEQWWQHIVDWSTRDQLSLPFLIWETRMPRKAIDGSRDNPVHCKFVGGHRKTLGKLRTI